MKQVRVTQIYFVSVSHFNWTIVSVKVSYQQLAAMVVICKINFDVLDTLTSMF